MIWGDYFSISCTLCPGVFWVLNTMEGLDHWEAEEMSEWGPGRWRGPRYNSHQFWIAVEFPGRTACVLPCWTHLICNELATSGGQYRVIEALGLQCKAFVWISINWICSFRKSVCSHWGIKLSCDKWRIMENEWAYRRRREHLYYQLNWCWRIGFMPVGKIS